VVEFVFSILAAVRVFFSTRRDTALEVLALRQQLAEAQTTASTGERRRSAVLDYAAPSLVTVDQRPHYREAGHRHRLAPPWFPSVLALAVATGRRAA